MIVDVAPVCECGCVSENHILGCVMHMATPHSAHSDAKPNHGNVMLYVCVCRFCTTRIFQRDSNFNISISTGLWRYAESAVLLPRIEWAASDAIWQKPRRQGSSHILGSAKQRIMSHETRWFGRVMWNVSRLLEIYFDFLKGVVKVMKSNTFFKVELLYMSRIYKGWSGFTQDYSLRRCFTLY